MSLPSYRWPLMNDPFSMWDRIKLSAFVCNPRNRWTQGEQVAALEKEMADYIGCRYAVFVSSGSTANTILAMMLRDESKQRSQSSGHHPIRNTVVFPSTTWTTSVSPFLREGFKPAFIDISLTNLGLNLTLLEEYLSNNNQTVAAVFITSLLGMCPDVARLAALKQKYPDIRFWLDNCENHLSNYDGCNISSFFTSTTSTYWGHCANSVEGGFVFTNDPDERDFALMARNHGMTRSVADPSAYRNPDVDSRFDFYLLGNNFRNTDIAAYIGRMDLKRIAFYARRRRELYKLFLDCLKGQLIVRFEDSGVTENAMFAIPLIVNPSLGLSNSESVKYKERIEAFCKERGIETRPVISGNLLAQRCYRDFGNRADYPVSEYVHYNGMYVGLYPGLRDDMVRELAGFVNEL